MTGSATPMQPGVDPETLATYEAQSDRYEAQRSPRFRTAAAALGARSLDGPVVDLGSGPGWYTAPLGQRAVAIDAARAMARRTRAVAPQALVAQADLAALPFRRGSLGGGWARNTYVHLRPEVVPAALADLHRSLMVGAPAELTFFVHSALEDPAWLASEDAFPGDDLPGRWFSTWPEQTLRDVLVGAGFDVEETGRRDEDGEVAVAVARLRRARTLPDTVGRGLRLLVCGLNPSLHAADAGVGFVTPGNRFWPAALSAGLVSRDRDPWHALHHHGVGMTDLAKRATPRADELTAAEYQEGLARVGRLCAWLRPGAVCMVGLAGWRAAADRKAVAGWQPESLGGVPVYVMPSTSGLNAATSVAAHTEHIQAALAGP